MSKIIYGGTTATPLKPSLLIGNDNEWILDGGDASAEVELFIVDKVMSDTSDNSIANKVVKNYVDSNIKNVSDNILSSIDNEMSDESINPVANKIVKKYVDSNIKNVNDKILPLADYIVESGVNGNWTYRKWNSGLAECWGIAETTATITNKYGDAHYFDGDVNDANANINKKIAFLSIDYPFEFKTRPIVQAQLMYTEKHQVDIRVGQYTDSLTKTPHYHLCAPFPIEKELTYRITYYVIGKWK